MENSERLGQQAGSRIEPGTSYLPVLKAELLGHWWSHQIRNTAYHKFNF